LIPIQHRLKIASSPIREALRQAGCDLRVSMPAIVVEFDPDRQVVSVQPALQEGLLVNAVPTLTTLPILDDVPVVFPTAGGWSLTLPIQPGDECDLVFADMAFDHWWESGGVQKQPDGVKYRHDIGDAKAHFGIRSQPRRLANWSVTSAQLRSDDGTVVIDLAAAGITLTGPAVNIVANASAAAAAGGVAQPVMTGAWLTWFLADVVPWMNAHGYTGPAPPVNSKTSTFTAE
jgi:hypothetical protein